MRLLVEIFIIAGVIYLGWEQPISQRLEDLTGDKHYFVKATPTPTPVPHAVVRAIPTPSGAWMKDPNRRTLLDNSPPTPAISPTIAQSSVPAQPNSWMFDPNRHSTLDAPKHSATPH